MAYSLNFSPVPPVKTKININSSSPEINHILEQKRHKTIIYEELVKFPWIWSHRMQKSDCLVIGIHICKTRTHIRKHRDCIRREIKIKIIIIKIFTKYKVLTYI